MKKLFLPIIGFLIFGFVFAANYNTKLVQSITWMYGSGLTIFANPTDFMANQSLRRDEASKFFVQYAIQVQKLVPDETKTECNKFSDLSKGRPDLKETMKTACKLGLFQGSNGKFMPDQLLTNAQAITVLIRLIDGKKDESGIHFGQKYFEKAEELGIMDGLSLNSSTKFDKLATRGEVGMLLYTTNSKNIVSMPINDSPIAINEFPIIPTYCTITQHLNNGQCVSNVQSCSIVNGIGQKTYSNNSWGICSVTNCNNGYQILNNSCVIVTQQQPTCLTNQHLESNQCVSNVQSCSIANGIGQKIYLNNSRGACVVVSCDSGYIISNGVCVSNPILSKELVSVGMLSRRYTISSDQQYVYYQNNEDWEKLYRKSLSNINANSELVLDYIVFNPIGIGVEYGNPYILLSKCGTLIYYNNGTGIYRKKINEDGLGDKILDTYRNIFISLSVDGNYMYYNNWSDLNNNVYKKVASDDSTGNLIITINKNNVSRIHLLGISDLDQIVYYHDRDEGKIYKRGFNESEGTQILVFYGNPEITIIPGGFIYRNPNDGNKKYKKILNIDGFGERLNLGVADEYKGEWSLNHIFGNKMYYYDGGKNLFKIDMNY